MLMPIDDDFENDTCFNEKWPDEIDLLDSTYEVVGFSDDKKDSCYKDDSLKKELYENVGLESDQNKEATLTQYNSPYISHSNIIRPSLKEDHVSDITAVIKPDNSALMQHENLPVPLLEPSGSLSHPTYLFSNLPSFTGPLDSRYSLLRRFICEVCQKEFSSKKGLKQHQLIHYGEKKFVCSYCDKRFLRKKDWQCHEKTHNMISWSPQRIVPVCHNENDTFVLDIQQNSGNSPLASGTTKLFHCGFCFKRFSAKRYLSQHQRYHCPKLHSSKLNIKRCSIVENGFQCSKRFNNGVALRNHFELHLDKGKYPCSLCERCFVREDELKRHYQIHSGELKPGDENL